MLFFLQLILMGFTAFGSKILAAIHTPDILIDKPVCAIVCRMPILGDVKQEPFVRIPRELDG